MKLTPGQARHALESGKRSVNNRREYRHHGGVCYPVASLVWTIATGEWPAKTPRHIDGNPLNNDFSNLRSPGRAPYKRKPKMTAVTFTGEGVPLTDAQERQLGANMAAAIDAQALATVARPQGLFA